VSEKIAFIIAVRLA